MTAQDPATAILCVGGIEGNHTQLNDLRNAVLDALGSPRET